jgi:hypothetical protein
MQGTIRTTRFSEIGYERHTASLWRIIDLETGLAIGPHYATKAELLADLARFHAERFTVGAGV